VHPCDFAATFSAKEEEEQRVEGEQPVGWEADGIAG